MKLQTKRLILRELENKDLKELVKQANNLNVSRYLAAVPYPYTIKDGKWFINHCKKEAKKVPRKKYEFAICDKSDKIMGIISFNNIDYFNGTGTIGYWLGEEYHRNGYMSEALKKIIEYIFLKLKLRRIDISAFVENKASNSLIKKFRFRYEGKRYKHVRATSTKKIHDHYVYGLLKKDWRRKR